MPRSLFISVGTLLIYGISHSRERLRAITLKSSYVFPILSDPQFSFFFFPLWIVLKV